PNVREGTISDSERRRCEDESEFFGRWFLAEIHALRGRLYSNGEIAGVFQQLPEQNDRETDERCSPDQGSANGRRYIQHLLIRVTPEIKISKKRPLKVPAEPY